MTKKKANKPEMSTTTTKSEVESGTDPTTTATTTATTTTTTEDVVLGTSKRKKAKTKKKTKKPRVEHGDNADGDGGDIELGNASSLPRPPSPPLNAQSELDIDALPIADATPEGIKTTDFAVMTALNVVRLMTDPETGKSVIRPVQDDSLRSPGHGVGRRPSLISIRCFKKSWDYTLGLTFRSVDGVLKINSIQPDMASSSLRTGDELIGLDNHRHCSRWAAVEAVQYMRNHRPGHISMLVRNPTGDPNLHEAIVYKAYPDNRVGVIFGNDEQGRLRIQSLKPSGLVGHMSALNVGDYVETINGDMCTHVDAEVARDMVRSSLTRVSIVSKQTDSTEISLNNLNLPQTMSESTSLAVGEGFVAAETLSPTELGESIAPLMDVGTLEYLEEEGIKPRFVYVQCNKPTLDTKLGISFTENDGTGLKISKIDDAGVLWSSPLKAGFDVLAIDGKVCTSWSHSETVDYLKNRQMEISFVARNTSGTPSYVVAQAPKPSPRAKVGLTFRKVGTRPLVIGQVHRDGIFAGSILNDTDEALSINGVPARNLSTNEACAIVEHATDTVTVVARTSTDRGVVLATLGPGESHVTIPSTQLQDQEQKRINPCIFCSICLAIVVFFIAVIVIGPSDSNFR